MGAEIIISVEERVDHKTISLENWVKKRARRRKRVAKRMAKRFPLFAVEFMQSEFPDYSLEQYEDDTKPSRRKKSQRKGKSPLKRQGRYPLMVKALNEYYHTKDIEFLHKAQSLRNRLFSRFEVVYSLNGERKVFTFPSSTDIAIIQDLGSIKFKSWEELDEILEDKLRYSHLF